MVMGQSPVMMDSCTVHDAALAELLTLTVKDGVQGARMYLNHRGQMHRRYGPAAEYPNGDREWWLYGQPHRTDGPAVDWVDGTREWWIDGESYTEKQFNELMTYRAT